ncbi:MAG: response regulator [Myxococcaceae bacterium]
MITKPLIVYVEDDLDSFRLTQLRLQAKYELLHAPNDADACALVQKHADQLYAILMDIELQGSLLDGLQLSRLIRGLSVSGAVPAYAKQMPKLPHVPIIVMTAYVTKYSEADVKQHGASQLLTKPIDFTRLNLALAQANIQSVMARLATPAQRR